MEAISQSLSNDGNVYGQVYASIWQKINMNVVSYEEVLSKCM